MGFLAPTLRFGPFLCSFIFGVGTLFIILGIFAYSNHSLGHDITFWMAGMIFLVLIWFALYAFGRNGKIQRKGANGSIKGLFKRTNLKLSTNIKGGALHTAQLKFLYWLLRWENLSFHKK